MDVQRQVQSLALLQYHYKCRAHTRWVRGVIMQRLQRQLPQLTVLA